MQIAANASSAAPLTTIETWLQAHREQRLTFVLHDSATHSFFIQVRGVLEELVREDDDGDDYRLEMRLEGDQVLAIYAQLIDEVNGDDTGLAIQYHAGEIEIEVDSEPHPAASTDPVEEQRRAE